MDYQEILHDKRFQIGAGIAVAIGAYELYKSKGTGTTDTSSTDAAGVAGTTGSSGTPTFDDGGSDISATLGNFSTELQGILQNYASTVTTTGTSGTTIPPKTTTPIVTPKPKPKPVGTKPKPKPVSKPTFRTLTIKRGDTLSGIAKKDHTTVSALAKLNGIKDVNLIYAGHKLKVPTAPKKK
jgi:LysM repeat protein